MKKALLLVVTLLVFATLSAAQTAPAPALPPTPPASHFVLSGNVSGFMGTKTTNSAVIASAGLQLTRHLAAGYEHINVSSINSRWELGVLAYTRPLDELLGSKLNSKLVFDASTISVTFTAGAGKLLQPTVNRVAETAGIHISYPLADHISMQIIGVDVLHGGVQTGFLTTNTSEAISTGLNFTF